MNASFAVVGHTNEGKSSVVATLLERDDIRVGAEAGTTRDVNAFKFTIDGEMLFSVVDTPGFERAAAVLEWLRQSEPSAAQRPARIAEFIEHFRGTSEFREEVRLLQAIRSGHIVLYVVDGSHPYRRVFEDELEIIRWTGAPTVGLINKIRSRDYTAQWHDALGQYFKIVRDFNAHTVPFEQRLQLFEDLCSIDPNLRAVLNRATEALRHDRQRRLEAASRLIAERTLAMVKHQVVISGRVEDVSREQRQRAEQSYHDDVRRLEQRTRAELVAMFRYRHLEYRQSELDMAGEELQADLFADGTFRVFGLSPKSLTIAAGLGGAVAGGAVDAAVAGHSFMLGAVVGGAVGAGSTFLKLMADPRAKGSFNGACFRVGPHPNPMFGTVVLDRALVFAAALRQRTHAQRHEMIVDPSVGQGADSLQRGTSRSGVVEALAMNEKKRLVRVIARARDGRSDDGDVEQLSSIVRGLMDLV